MLGTTPVTSTWWSSNETATGTSQVISPRPLPMPRLATPRSQLHNQPTIRYLLLLILILILLLLHHHRHPFHQIVQMT